MLIRASLLAFMATALLGTSGPAAAASRKFSIGNQPFSEKEILDARAQPQIDGTIVILLSFDEAAARKIAMITGANIANPLPVELDGKTLLQPIVRDRITGGQLEISGKWKLAEAEKLAKLISGKDPLPDDLEGE